MSKLTTYIEKELKKGFSQQQIKAVLLKYHYDEQLVDEAFTQVSHHEFPQHKLEVPHMGKMMFGIIMAITIAMIVLFSVRYVQKTYFDQDAFLKEYRQEQAVLAATILKTTACKELEEIDQRDLCLLKLSAEKNDVSYCDAIEAFGVLADCKAKIWEKDECGYLDVIGEDVNECYIEKAIQKKELSYCTNSLDYEKCKIAFFSIHNTIEVCKNDFVCIIAFAQTKHDSSFCKKNLLAKEYQQLCLDSFKTDNPNKK